MKVLGVIPARHAAQRFPGKPLALLLGRPMIQWVHERVSRATTLSSVLVATDDERIADCVRGFGGEALMTSTSHQSGTDRVAEVARRVDADVYVNVQGDEPLIDPASIDAAVKALLADESAGWSTLVTPLRTRAEYDDPSVVKVAVADDAAASGGVGVALYFSRAPIPWKRGLAAGDAPPATARRHVGLYAFRKRALESFASWAPSPLELCESLEQLRALERGVRIVVAEASGLSLAVDNPEDVPAVEACLKRALADG